MNKITSLVSLLLMCITLLGQNSLNNDSNFSFYKSIPQYESISLSGQDISIKIYPNYTVMVSASKNDSYLTAIMKGTGSISYDYNTKSLFLDINGTIKGSYSRDEEVYRTEKEYNVGSTTLNVLFGSGTSEKYRYVKKYDHTDYWRADCNKNFTCRLPLTIYGSTYKLSSKEISATLTGNTSKTVSFYFKDNVNDLRYGEKKEQQNSVTDVFGKWEWNSDRTVIWLTSDNIPDCKLCIFDDKKNTGILYLYFSFGSSVTGKAVSRVNSSTLQTFELTFEDGSTTDLSFSNKGVYTMRYYYVNYNRFLEQEDYNATSIISQLSAKKTLMINYSMNGSSYLGMFTLEGLETILSYIK